ncbi:MAG: hypothetical protein PHY34_00185 [Patescibacteria group bacterium]|nr:hypothetical protein [Patescibacteria group bacterium]MDD5715950.1 hypothetical protein [Patescibacteria group bacterium]
MSKTFLLGTILTATAVIALTAVLPTPSTLAAETADAPVTLPNPLGKKTGTDEPISMVDVLLRVMQIALMAVDVFALFMFILGGFEMLISAGNPNMIKKAKDTLIWATLGILVITFSYSILKFVFEEVRKGFA